MEQILKSQEIKEKKKTVKESLANPKSTMERGKAARELVYMPKGYLLRSSIRY